MINLFMPFSIPLNFAKTRCTTEVSFTARIGLNILLIIFSLSYLFSARDKMTTTGIRREKAAAFQRWDWDDKIYLISKIRNK